MPTFKKNSNNFLNKFHIASVEDPQINASVTLLMTVEIKKQDVSEALLV